VNIGTDKRKWVGHSGQFGIILFAGIGCDDAADWRTAKYNFGSDMNVCMCVVHSHIPRPSLRKMHGSTPLVLGEMTLSLGSRGRRPQTSNTFLGKLGDRNVCPQVSYF
jgi:hypothetical protein